MSRHFNEKEKGKKKREGSISPKAKPTAFRALSNRSVATHLIAAPLGNRRFP